MGEDIIQQPIQKRQTAYKTWIKNLYAFEGVVDSQTGFPTFFFQGQRVVRVNILGSIIDTFLTESYGSFVLDDSSGQVRLKVWGEDLGLFQGKGVGDIVLVIGKVAEFQGERYLRPEILRKVDFDWALYRRLELTKLQGIPTGKVVLEKETVSPSEGESSLFVREHLLQTIEKEGEIGEEALLQGCQMAREKVVQVLYLSLIHI